METNEEHSEDGEEVTTETVPRRDDDYARRTQYNAIKEIYPVDL